MKKICIVFYLQLFVLAVNAQSLPDSAIRLKEVTIAIYPDKPLLLHSTITAATLGPEELKNYPSYSFTSAINTLPGVRMEERSPGSYRLSIRGSLLRSPFGIRNIKVYMDEFLLTDGGGNTYINLLDLDATRTIQVLKGPEGSMFGANTGGVVVLGTTSDVDSSKAVLKLSGGSYGLFNEHSSLNNRMENYSINLDQSYYHSNGYRKQSEMERNYTRLLQNFRYKKGNVKLLLLGSQLHYETPGGLTLSQFQNDPQQARPATSRLPGAEEQKAGIYNSSVYGGISNEVHILPHLKHVITLFGSYTDFKNPFVTNYETRNENTAGLRTYFTLNDQFSIARISWTAGFEYEQTGSRISNYTNIDGTKDKLISKDDLTAGQYFFFSQLTTLISTRIQIELAASLNNYYFHYRNLFPTDESNSTKKKLNTQMMPRAGISYRIVNNLVWRVSASKGYSAPTIAEIRPSDNIIHTQLQSEYGWNYETGLRFKTLNQKWEADLSVFRFDLRDAIVRRTNTDGNEYFVNAGGTKQQGIEFQSNLQLFPEKTTGAFRGSHLYTGFTYSDFHFSEYKIDTSNYSGNELTGVPRYTLNTGISSEFPFNLNLFINYSFTDRIPLADNNSAYADPFHILNARVGWKYMFKNKIRLELFIGGENLTNTMYSLGNDLNAVGGRYFNPAPGRNYYGGLSIIL